MDDLNEHIDVFVSYARADRARVRPLIDALEASGWRVFWDHDIPPGWTWDEYIGARLETATVVLVLWSKESVRSEFVRTEAARARRRRAMVPARIDDVEQPVEFERVQAADLIDWIRTPEPSLSAILNTELTRRIQAAAGKKPASEAVPAPTPDQVADVARTPAPPQIMAGPVSSGDQTASPVGAPAKTATGKTPWRWSELDTGGRVGLALGGAIVAFLIVSGMIGAIR